MAELLGWPVNKNISWTQIINLVTDPNGWNTLNRSYGFGNFKYGYGHPSFSTSGRLSLATQVHIANSTITIIISKIKRCRYI
jgi:Ca-activated chloride channel family protein